MEHIQADQLSSYSEKDLREIVNNPFEYTSETIDVAREELKKRAVSEMNPESVSDTGSDQDIIQSEPNDKQLYNAVRLKLAGGDDVDTVARYLKNKGVSDDEAVKMLEKAVKSPKYKKPEKKDNSSKGIGIFGILFIAYIIIKWTYRLMNNG